MFPVSVLEEERFEKCSYHLIIMIIIKVMMMMIKISIMMIISGRSAPVVHCLLQLLHIALGESKRSQMLEI